MDQSINIYPLAFTRADMAITLTNTNISILKKDRVSDFSASDLIPQISIDSIEKVILDENQLSITLFFYERTMESSVYYFSERDDLLSFIRELSNMSTFKPGKTRLLSKGIPWRYVIMLTLSIIFSAALYKFALFATNPANDVEISGRNNILKAIILMIVGILGPPGILMAGCIWVGFSGYKIYKVMKFRTNKVEYFK